MEHIDMVNLTQSYHLSNRQIATLNLSAPIEL